MLPGQLSMNGMQGDLLSEMTIDRVHYTAGPQKMEIRNLKMRCSPLALVGGRLQIDSLDIEKMSFMVAENIDIKGIPALVEHGWANVTIPVTTAFDRLGIGELIVNLSNRRLALRNVNLKGRLKDNRLFVVDFESQFDRLRIGLNGEMNLTAPLLYAGRLRWRSSLVEVIDSAGTCTFKGDVDQMNVTIDIREPLSILTAGLISWEQNEITFTGMQPPATQASDHQNALILPMDASAMPLTVVDVENLQARILQGEVGLNGRLVWRNEPVWDLVFEVNRINPGSRFPDWPGELNGQATFRGRLTGGIPVLSITDINLEGRLLDQPLHLEGHIHTVGASLSEADLRIISGVNAMSLKSTGTSGNDVQLEFTVRDPYSLWPPFRGIFAGNGLVKDWYNSPEVSLNIDGSRIKYAAATVENMSADAVINLSNFPATTSSLVVNGIQLGKVFYPLISVSTSGGLGHMQVSGSIQSTDSQLDFKASGSAGADHWNLVAEDASLSSTAHGRWKLTEAVTISLDRDKLDPFSACWVQDQASRCIDVDWRFDSGLKVEGDHAVPPYQFISQFTQNLLDSRHEKSPDS